MSPGVPSSVMPEMYPAISEMATGSIRICLSPRRYSVSVLWREPQQP